MKIKDESEKIVLNLSHRGFGYQICLFSLDATLLVFIMELVAFRVKKFWKNFQNSKRTKVLVKVENQATTSLVKLVPAHSTSSVKENLDKRLELKTEPASLEKELEIIFGEKVNDHFKDTKHGVVLFLNRLIDNNNET